jgi:hypothetical protein
MKRVEKPAPADTVKTTIRVRRDLWNAVLHRSIDENRNLQAIVEQAIEQYLKKTGSKK